jgi:3-oxoadipate enol-lactonase
MMALQLALDAPAMVHSLALLESARPSPASPVQDEFVANVVRPAIGAYQAGDVTVAVETWMGGVCGSRYRTVLERNIPGAFEQSVADADTFFGQELPAVQQWTFGPSEADHVKCPVLAVLGTGSRPTFAERRELLLAWLPNVEPCDVVAASHLLPAEDPQGVAAALVEFFDRHPMAT